jgi:hypothetical protein
MALNTQNKNSKSKKAISVIDNIMKYDDDKGKLEFIKENDI